MLRYATRQTLTFDPYSGGRDSKYQKWRGNGEALLFGYTHVGRLRAASRSPLAKKMGREKLLNRGR